ncbi:putative two-component response regulator-like APRR4 [Salvia hispanica]|uniref:putative two-component response regulator-like APRR4 n=1 Tax=Salvia hispanica TaxID=49212 RepID=UPI002009698E|nr:putative two-component response regulator-like APRR4 [Salvia hispanica]
MSNDDDIMNMGAWAIENGAFLYIKRPTKPEMLRYLWQHVARETRRVLTRESERPMAASYATPQCGVGFGEIENPSNLFAIDKGKNKMNYYYNEKYVEKEYNFDNNMKRKICIRWTDELHQKFVDAVEQLGKGNIYPKEILEKMNVSRLAN